MYRCNLFIFLTNFVILLDGVPEIYFDRTCDYEKDPDKMATVFAKYDLNDTDGSRDCLLDKAEFQK